MSLMALNLIEDEKWVYLLTGAAVDPLGEVIKLAPYQFMWISNGP